MSRTIAWIRIAGLVMTVATAAACGESEETASTGRPMVAPPEAVSDHNQPPQVTDVYLDPSSPESGRRVHARTTASDPDGDAVRLVFRWTVNGRPLAQEGHVVPLPELRKGDRVAVEVVASDGRLESEPFRAQGVVGNRRPSVTALSVVPEGDVHPGDLIRVEADGQDPDGDSLDFRFEWFVNGSSTGREGREFETAGLRRDDEVSVRVVASDGTAVSEAMRSSAIRLANSPPMLLGVPRAENQGGVFTYRFEAKDPDGDRRLRFRLAQAPAGMTIDPVLGVATWRPAPGQAGVHPVEVVVEDAKGDGSALQFDVRVTATVVNQAGAPPAAPQP